MKLWTIQERAFVEADTTRPIVADWSKTPVNWRSWYAWMAQQWNARVGVGTMTTPLWCWHSCKGIHQSCPTVGTFASLMGDWNYYASRMMVLECEIPDALPLLSSYSRWNQAIDDAMDCHSDAIDGQRFADMFQAPLFKHETDDIQAVIPRIERNWITAQWLLPLGDLSELDWGLPCTRFPRTPEQANQAN
jgi:hypothetical protein